MQTFAELRGLTMSYQLQMVKSQQMLDIREATLVEISHPGIFIPMFCSCQSNVITKESYTAHTTEIGISGALGKMKEVSSNLPFHMSARNDLHRNKRCHS